MREKVTGRHIILHILYNMEESLEDLWNVTLAPSFYDVYLREDDYDRLVGIFPRIRDQAKRALEEQVRRLSGSSTFGLGKKKKVEPAAKDWHVRFHRTDEEDFESLDTLKVHSILALPPDPSLGAGALTQRTVTVRSGGTSKLIGRYKEDGEPPDHPVIAKLVYRDRRGRRREFLMTSTEIAIGRGGQTVYCDLQLDGPDDISRQHCYLRKQEDTAEFLIQDVSKFGTSVNGQKLVKMEWTRMPARAKISLANKLTLSFEAL